MQKYKRNSVKEDTRETTTYYTDAERDDWGFMKIEVENHKRRIRWRKYVQNYKCVVASKYSGSKLEDFVELVRKVRGEIRAVEKELEDQATKRHEVWNLLSAAQRKRHGKIAKGPRLKDEIEYTEAMAELDYIDKAQVKEYMCQSIAYGIAEHLIYDRCFVEEWVKVGNTKEWYLSFPDKPKTPTEDRLWWYPEDWISPAHSDGYKSDICYDYFAITEFRNGTKNNIQDLVMDFVVSNRQHICDIYCELFLV